MNIDDLIQELINLKSQGVETIELLDENGYDYGIDSIQQDGEDSKVGYLELYTK